MTQDQAHFMLVDSVLEESLETVAAASLLAAIIAIGHNVRERDLLVAGQGRLRVGAVRGVTHRRPAPPAW